MNPKVTGILLLIVGLGVGLYFVNSGAAGRFGALFSLPGSHPASSTLVAASSTSGSGSSPQASSSAATSTSPWVSFFQSLFAPHNFSNLPTVSSVNGGGSSGGGYVSSGGSNGSSGSSGNGGSNGNTGNTSSVTPPPGFTVAQLSPYYREVRLGGVSQGEISLSSYPGYGAPTSTVDITGWEIKTNHGGEFIPQAENLYYPVGVAPESDIILTLSASNIQYVNIYSNSAPNNLRLNSCMGYLNSTGQFNPGFAYDCPEPDRSQITQFTGACQNYILSLSGCEQPNFDSPYFPTKDYECEDYLQGKYNYNWCISNYGNQPGFLENEWRVWMGSSPLDPYHDNVELLDRNGLVVDAYSY